ncbi:MAG: hypothetical protein WCY61_05775 [Sphaerochaeta sp.]
MLHYAIYQSSSALRYELKRSYKIIFLIITLFLGWGLLLYLSEGVSFFSMIHIVVLLLLSIVGVLYRDGWTFDNTTQTASSWWGFGPWLKKETFAYSMIIRLELNHFIKGSAEAGTNLPKRRQKAMVLFELILTEERTRTVQVIAERTSSGRVEAAFNRIAHYTNLPARIDRPREVDLPLTMKDL